MMGVRGLHVCTQPYGIDDCDAGLGGRVLLEYFLVQVSLAGLPLRSLPHLTHMMMDGLMDDEDNVIERDPTKKKSFILDLDMGIYFYSEFQEPS